MPRIALLFEFPTLNGGERSLLAALDQLLRVRPDFEFTAIAPSEGRLAQALAQRKIATTSLLMHDDSGNRLPRETALERLNTAIESVQADVVHANSLSMGRLTGALGDACRVPRVSHLRDIIRISKAAIVDLNRNDRLVAVSRATRAFHLAQGLDADRATVLYNGVDCDRFAPRPAEGLLRRDLGLNADALLSLTIGQIGLRKGLDVLVEAAIARKNEPGDVHYVVVGERNSSKQESIEYEQAFIRRFEEAGLGDRLHRLGYRDDVPRLMNEADFLLHAAHQEPLGRVLLEAAASGLPIVATDVGGTGEIVEHGISAELVPQGDAAALAAAVSRFVNEPQLRLKYARAARESACNRFAIEAAAARLADLYDTLR